MKKIILVLTFIVSSSSLFAQFQTPDTTYYDDIARGFKNSESWKGLSTGQAVAAFSYIVNLREAIDSAGFASKADIDSLITNITILKNFVSSAANQVITNYKMDSLYNQLADVKTFLDSIEIKQGEIKSVLTTLNGIVSTAANQSSIITLLTNISGFIDGVETLIASTNTELQALNNKDFSTSVMQDSLLNKLKEIKLDMATALNQNSVINLLDSVRVKLSTLINQTDSIEIKQDELKVIVSLIQSGMATAANQLTIITSLNNLETYTDGIEALLNDMRTELITLNTKDFSTSAKQQEIIDSLISVTKELKSRDVVVDSIITIGTTAVQLPDIPCREFTAVNLTEAATVFFSTDPGITSVSDEYPLKYREGISDRLSNPKYYYGVSNTPGTKIKIKAVR